MKILFSIIGLFLGAVVDEGTGMFFGFFIGLLSGTLIQYRDRIRKLEESVATLRSNLIDSAIDVASASQSEHAPGHEPGPARAPAGEPGSRREPVATSRRAEGSPPPVHAGHTGEDEDDITIVPMDLDHTGEHTIPDKEEIPTLRPMEPPPGSVVYPDPISGFLRRFFTTGNVVVKVGVILLFIGVSFLLKLAVEQNLFPIEYRFSAVAIGAIVMLFVGWRMRARKHQYGLVVQGGAVGILYITVFSAAKLYHLVPLGLAFGLMFGLVLFSCILAVIQNARSLAVFATVGGFLAPILTSSGTGNHVALFSYYTLLNVGVFGIAWFKSWRSLNWVGFVFTFVIAALWGYRYYQPEYFNTTEPFLILFFLFYVGISVMYAHHQPPRLKGLVDGSLVFGTPLVGFTLQSGLVQDFEYGMTWSALVLAALYIGLARILWRRKIHGMRMLTEAFLSLGIIFATLAIPFALDGHWTAAAWALEGAGITWVGIRQNRLAARLFGLLLLAGASIAFMTDFEHPHTNLAVLNSGYIGSVLISLASLFVGLQYYRNRDHIHDAGRDLHVVLLVWGLIWWFVSGLVEIEYHVLQPYELNASLLFIALSSWLLFISARALGWRTAVYPPVLLLPVMVVLAAFRFLDQPHVNPFLNIGYLGWIAAFTVQYGLLYRAEDCWNEKLLGKWHAITMWLYVFMATWIIANAVSTQVPGLQNWNDLIWGLLPAAGVFKLIYMRHRFPWPMQRFERSYLCEGMFPMVVYLAFWVVVNCTRAGDPEPIPFIPLLNPQDIVQIIAMLAILDWLLKWKRNAVPPLQIIGPDSLLAGLGVVFFIWVNAVVARTVHFYADVPYSPDQMFESAVFQTSISIVWTLMAFILMGNATGRGLRKLWFTGALLLGAVVIKLFFVDLADSATVARIVSFISVGILMLIIGYYSPLPPREKIKETRA